MLPFAQGNLVHAGIRRIFQTASWNPKGLQGVPLPDHALESLKPPEPGRVVLHE